MLGITAATGNGLARFLRVSVTGCRREVCDTMSAILWAIVVILLLFWLFGLFIGNLGNILWVALVLAVAIALYNLLIGRTAY